MRHIFTGVAVYIYIVLVEKVTEDQRNTVGKDVRLSYAWPVSSILSRATETLVEKDS